MRGPRQLHLVVGRPHSHSVSLIRLLLSHARRQSDSTDAGTAHECAVLDEQRLRRIGVLAAQSAPKPVSRVLSTRWLQSDYRGCGHALICNDIHASADAPVTDEGDGSGDQSSDIPFRLPAKRAQSVASLVVASGAGHCSGPPNTEISGEPPFGPWLVRCISLFASVLILQDGWVLSAYRNPASVFELYRATGLGLPEINDLIWTLVDGRELAPKEKGFDTRQV
jgi:hypothetical protein